MSGSNTIENAFLNKITGIIEKNLSNEQFGVSELARETGMSRSNLLRKIKKLTKISASQFIRNLRLQHAMELLRAAALNVTEVSYEVGFNSTSYFIKCFRDYYGYPPGEVGKRDPASDESMQTRSPGKRRKIILIAVFCSIAVWAVVFIVFFRHSLTKQKEREKSIAVLPFKNDSKDSTNVYIINGLMESILDHLQNIKDLRVISRTSVEKYRNNPKTIPEIARELHVNYFVEGSGQKIGDQILLRVQLIDASSDSHLWSRQFSREAKDIFALQAEVAKDIANEIRAFITPDEEKRINKIPTDDLVAYDYFLKGLDLFNRGNREGLERAIHFFEMAVEQDHEFARAYADIAISYYLLDFNQTEKKHTEQINNFADKALLYDSKLPQSLIAKSLYYMNNAEYEQAVPYLEKALEYNPNSALVINSLSDFYANYSPNTEKYLEYALKGIRLDISAYDSSTASFIYLHVSNAFIQSGFVHEAETYINKSLEYDPKNLYAEYVKGYILYAKNGNLLQTRDLLIKAFNKDTTRLDIMQEIGKICYYMRDYKSAYQYYKKFIAIKEARNWDIYPSENAKIGVVLAKTGLKEKSDDYFEDYKNYAENDQSVYKHLSLAMYHSYYGNTKKALEQLKLFSEQNYYHYWTILFLKIDPLIDPIQNLPEFKRIFKDIENKFWDYHKQIKDSLEEKDLL